MANGVFNIAKGRVNGYVDRVANNDPTNAGLVVLLLKANETDATLEDYDDLSTLLGAAGNTEADFTNYARKVLTDADVSAPTPDDTGNSQSADIGDPVWSSAGGTTDNTLTKMVICYDSDTTGGNDSNIIPLVHLDFSATTNGNNLTGIVNAAGFYTAS